MSQGWREDVTVFVERLQEAGWVDPSRDPSMAAMEVLSYGEGLLAHAVLFGLNPDEVRHANVDGIARILSG
jgi:hypothetical protein